VLRNYGFFSTLMRFWLVDQIRWDPLRVACQDRGCRVGGGGRGGCCSCCPHAAAQMPQRCACACTGCVCYVWPLPL